MPSVRQLFVSPGHNYFGHKGRAAGEHPLVPVDAVECVAGRGIVGDRFFDYKPDYKGQLSLFSLEVFADLIAVTGAGEKSPSVVRRNLFTEGVDLNALVGREFTVGTVRLLGFEQCRPCFWMDSAVAPGAEDSLQGRGGLRCKILRSGRIRAGDEILLNDESGEAEQPVAPVAPRFAGLVLAGGESSRMGEDKAFLTVAGETLVARAARLLREAGCADLVVSGRAGVVYPELPHDIAVVYDAPGAEGPLAGILAALPALGGEITHLVTLPVDLPAMRAEILRDLMAHSPFGYGAVAASPAGPEPLVAVIPRELFPALRAAVAAGERSPRAFHASPEAAARLIRPAPRAPEDDAFTNWNRREDWAPPPVPDSARAD